MDAFRYCVPTEIVFGAGSIDSLGKRCSSLGRKPLIVTGRRSARATGLLDQVLGQVPEAILFDAIQENPTTEICSQGATICREKKCDYLLGVGGGSPMDAAKAIAVLATNDGPCSEYFGADRFPHPNLPIVAVPTTAGTGSEVTPYSVLIDGQTHSKRTIAGRSLFPTLALLDPTLTVSTPRHVTVNTGLDALSQAMEGLVSRRSTPIGDVLALETCRIVREWLPRAADEPTNIEARSQMQYAAMLSGCTIAHSGTTLIHGMGYYFTLEYGVAHGLANAVLLIPVFRYNAFHIPAKIAAIATALGQTADPEPDEAAEKLICGLRDLFHNLRLSPGLKNNIGPVEIEPNTLRRFAESIFPDRARFKNQPGEPTLDEVHAFFKAAWEGLY